MAFTLRHAVPGDAPAILQMFDDNVAWLVANGNMGQWGTEPWSKHPKRVKKVEDMIGLDDTYVAEVEGEAEPVGFLVCGKQSTYVPPPTGPELYVGWLVASRSPVARGVGRFMLAHAEALAREKGLPKLRLDCYRGGEHELVRFYEKCGFEKTVAMEDAEHGWPFQILEKRV